MNGKENIRELFVILKSGLPLAHVGTGSLEIDDALLGGLLSAISDVGLSLGLSDDGALDTIAFRAYLLVYTQTKNALIVLLTSEETPEFYRDTRQELESIGTALEREGFLEESHGQYGLHLPKITSIIARIGRTIFAKQNDVFIFDENHTFQLVEGTHKRWDGENLFKNYLLLSPMTEVLTIPMDDMQRICYLLQEKRKPSELMQDEEISVKEPDKIEDTLRFLHLFGIIQCYGSTII